MSMSTVKEGPLFKKGKINTEWRERLFVLNKKQLAYFKGSKHSPSGVIEMKNIREVSDILEDGTFRVVTPNRTYEIKGSTKEETEQWIEVLRQIHQDHN